MKKFLSTAISFDLPIKYSLFLKGFAIMMIIIHNFCHALPGFCKENEYLFDVNNTLNWLQNFQNAGPHIILNIFSFWGHYGVSIFLFLSGFGLVRKYESSSLTTSLKILPFLKKHYLKLCKLLIPALCLTLLIAPLLWNLNINGMISLSAYMLLLLTFISNLIPNTYIIFGPWWFFSLIMQCYCLYSFCFYNKRRSAPYIFSLVSITLLIITATFLPSTFLHYIRFNIFGWVLPFALGVILARKSISIPIWLSLISLVIFILCEFSIYSWIFSPLFLCFGIIPLIRSIKIYPYSILVFLGKISSAIFVIHPITRQITFNIFDTNSVYTSIIFYLAFTISMAYLYHITLKKIYKS